MASAIDATKPVAGSPTTQSVRDNFATAASEITALQTAPNQTITLSGDIAGSGTAAITTTLPTVNANVGTFQGLTVNAKGQVTAAANQSYAPLASPAFTGTPTINGAAFTAGHLPGTATSDDAAAGQVGEVISVLVGSGVTLPNNTATTVVTISLTAGDWDLYGEAWFEGTTVVGTTAAKISITPAETGATPTLTSSFILITNAQAGTVILPLCPVRLSLASTTSMYLNLYQFGTSSGAIGMGKLVARRAR